MEHVQVTSSITALHQLYTDGSVQPNGTAVGAVFSPDLPLPPAATVRHGSLPKRKASLHLLSFVPLSTNQDHLHPGVPHCSIFAVYTAGCCHLIMLLDLFDNILVRYTDIVGFS
ncbi:hypothetical protein E2C01_027247 [Portunus trituberculatus]|uniref:Uncharacterized protein n=1 Tax=Portunus trituberculatus TaxID=210409 RepID=A0A5B7EHE9_PORTR|nr:hypothetical protein [Portunus trituberculatus]